jgi:hypothetical protein
MDRKKELDDLKIKRAKLFEQFLKHPVDNQLVLSIQYIKDQLAYWRQRVEITEKNSTRPHSGSSKN